MAHDDDVGIVGHHLDCVLERLTFRGARCFRVGETDNPGPQSISGSLEAEPGSGGGFEEKCRHNFSFKNFPVRMSLHFACHVEQVLYFLVAVGRYGDDASVRHCYSLYSL